MKDVIEFSIVLIVLYRAYRAVLETAARFLPMRNNSHGTSLPKWLSFVLTIRCDQNVRPLGVCFSFVGPFPVKLALIAYLTLSMVRGIAIIFDCSVFAIPHSMLLFGGIFSSVYAVAMIVLFGFIDWLGNLRNR